MIVPIITDEAHQEGGWHGAALKQAFLNRGYQVAFVQLQDCSIDLSTSHPKIEIPGFLDLPKLAFVRGVAAGTLQQVITRLNILHILRMQGVKVYNDAKAIERTVDKGMTSFILKHHGIATPDTWVCESRKKAEMLINVSISDGNNLVIKPLFGSQGKGVRLLSRETPLPLPKDMFVDGVYYLQAYIDTGEARSDYRVFVVNNKAIAGMRRQGTGWLHNVAQGALCETISDTDIFFLAEQAASVLDIDYCGVDIIRDLTGKLWVLEVNSIPAWQGLQSVSQIEIAQILVDDLISRSNA